MGALEGAAPIGASIVGVATEALAAAGTISTALAPITTVDKASTAIRSRTRRDIKASQIRTQQARSN
ncbi:hypothetical protein Back2_18290 [Nocardioides baekrokdamisoli]|uniref:Uncharacterized protein n=1 Tax=Nocardioides baekrokdamisoli TaxID=1804624 RepID=A0A3G9IH65_9ACTN|nr:hypothetical protein Back2_18290 [Nocardioides baekrokdamisoli]